MLSTMPPKEASLKSALGLGRELNMELREFGSGASRRTHLDPPSPSATPPSETIP